MTEHYRTLQPRLRSAVLQFCSIHHQIYTSSGRLRTFHQEKDLRTRMHCKNTVVQYFTSIGKEHDHKGLFKLLKQWKNNHQSVAFLDLIAISMLMYFGAVLTALTLHVWVWRACSGHNIADLYG
jgi:hypothetical protein